MKLISTLIWLSTLLVFIGIKIVPGKNDLHTQAGSQLIQIAATESQANPLTGNLTGKVVSKASGLPIAGALVNLPTLGLSTYTDREGAFTWNDLPLPEAIFPVTVTVTAAGYGDWTIRSVRLLAGDTLILTPHLTLKSYTDTVPAPAAEQPDRVLPENDIQLETLPINSIHVPRPKFIRVRVSGWPYDCDTSRDYTVEVIEFKQYLRNVLPNEWNPVWNINSLRAGAMAVKGYAWSVLSLGYKWSDADVWDSTCDQVYNPNFEYQSTNDAIDDTFDYLLGETDTDGDDILFHTSYRAWYYQCVDAGKEGRCMGQWDSKEMADTGSSWQDILLYFYVDSFILPVDPPAPEGYDLRYNGSTGDNNENRVLFPVDDPDNQVGTKPVDVGAEDFTIEWWLKSLADENTAPAITCGANGNWVYGNMLLDRDRASQDRRYGISLAGGKLTFGIGGDGTGDFTLCGTKPVTDNIWHHVAVERQRSDGHLWLFVDGQLQAQSDGPDGDISYPDAYTSTVESDPFLALGAWKEDTNQDQHPFFNGWIDELRFSNTLRYTQTFTVTRSAFIPDDNTLALFHFDEGVGNLVYDSMGGQESLNQGNRKYGGTINGPEWEVSDLFLPPVPENPQAYLPLILK